MSESLRSVVLWGKSSAIFMPITTYYLKVDVLNTTIPSIKTLTYLHTLSYLTPECYVPDILHFLLINLLTINPENKDSDNNRKMKQTLKIQRGIKMIQMELRILYL